MSLNPPNPDCETCSFVQIRVEVNPDLATFEHLVTLLRKDLGYDQLSLTFDQVIYANSEEPDLDDNLGKKLSHFKISNESVLTVGDESETDTRVDLEVLIIER